MNFSIIISL